MSLRKSLKVFKEKQGNKIVSALECGVADGKNAWLIFNHLRIKKLYLVDSWLKVYKEDRIKWVESVFDKFEGERKIFIIRSNAIDAVDLFPDGNLDYIYLDDLHNGDHVYKEMELYMPKVSQGGMLAGHDYDNNLPDRVKSGVDRFVSDHNLKLYVSDLDWWIWV